MRIIFLGYSGVFFTNSGFMTWSFIKHKYTGDALSAEKHALMRQTKVTFGAAPRQAALRRPKRIWPDLSDRSAQWLQVDGLDSLCQKMTCYQQGRGSKAAKLDPGWPSQKCLSEFIAWQCKHLSSFRCLIAMAMMIPEGFSPHKYRLIMKYELTHY